MAEPHYEPNTPLATYLREYHTPASVSGSSSASSSGGKKASSNSSGTGGAGSLSHTRTTTSSSSGSLASAHGTGTPLRDAPQRYAPQTQAPLGHPLAYAPFPDTMVDSSAGKALAKQMQQQQQQAMLQQQQQRIQLHKQQQQPSHSQSSTPTPSSSRSRTRPPQQHQPVVAAASGSSSATRSAPSTSAGGTSDYAAASSSALPSWSSAPAGAWSNGSTSREQGQLPASASSDSVSLERPGATAGAGSNSGSKNPFRTMIGAQQQQQPNGSAQTQPLQQQYVVSKHHQHQPLHLQQQQQQQYRQAYQAYQQQSQAQYAQPLKKSSGPPASAPPAPAQTTSPSSASPSAAAGKRHSRKGSSGSGFFNLLRGRSNSNPSSAGAEKVAGVSTGAGPAASAGNVAAMPMASGNAGQGQMQMPSPAMEEDSRSVSASTSGALGARPSVVPPQQQQHGSPGSHALWRKPVHATPASAAPAGSSRGQAHTPTLEEELAGETPPLTGLGVSHASPSMPTAGSAAVAYQQYILDAAGASSSPSSIAPSVRGVTTPASSGSNGSSGGEWQSPAMSASGGRFASYPAATHPSAQSVKETQPLPPPPRGAIEGPSESELSSSSMSDVERDGLDMDSAWDLSAKMPAPPPRPLSIASNRSNKTIGAAGGDGAMDSAHGHGHRGSRRRSQMTLGGGGGGVTGGSGAGANGNAVAGSSGGLGRKESTGSNTGSIGPSGGKRFSTTSSTGSAQHMWDEPEGEEAWASLHRTNSTRMSLLSRFPFRSPPENAGTVGSPRSTIAGSPSATATPPAEYIDADSAEYRKSQQLPRNSPTNKRSHSLPPQPAAAPPRRASRVGKVFAGVADFGREVLKALRMILHAVVLPIVFSLLSLLSGGLLARKSKKREASTLELAADAAPASLLSTKLSKSDALAFAEKFKYLICTSFLLTPSLSISFYDEQPPSGGPLDSSPTRRTSEPTTGETAGVAQLLAAYKEVAASTQESHHYQRKYAGSSNTMPPLSDRGEDLRNGLLLAAMVLGFWTRNLAIWFRTTLLLVAGVWVVVTAFGLHARERDEEALHFDLTHVVSSSAVASESPLSAAFASRLTKAVDAAAGKSVASQANATAQQLVTALRHWDLEIKRALTAVKEAEVVSRGYKLTHPLPPISRIEHSSSIHRAVATSPLRSVSGASATGPRHLRQISLTTSSAPSVSTAGRASPQLFDTSMEMEDGMSSQTSYSAGSLTMPQDPQMTMLPLRRAISKALDEAEACSMATVSRLAELMDKDEWELLKEMYSLEVPSAAPVESEEHASTPTISDVPLLPERAPSAQSKRLSLLIDTGDSASPSRGHKRLSLLGNGIKSLDSAATSPALDGRSSKRSSMILDEPPRSGSSTTSNGRTTPSFEAQRRPTRLGYVHSSDTTPNESAASKRLSYASSTTSAASLGISGWRPTTTNLTIGQLTPSNELFARAPSPQISPQPNVTLSRNVSQASAAATTAVEPDPLSIVTLQARHETVHLARRKMLVGLLALKFDQDGAYWERAQQIMSSAASFFLDIGSTLSRQVRIQMGYDPPAQEPKQARNGPLDGHPGLEDRMQTIGLTLRSIQLKIQSCAADLHVKQPPELHGTEAPTQPVERPPPSDYVATTVMFESIKDDLLALSAEWEAGLHIFKKESKRSTSPKRGSLGNIASPRTSGAREFESPQEVDEDEWGQSEQPGPGAYGDTSGMDDSDITSLIRQSIDPRQLPPPGLEQIFESIAGLAGAKAPNSKVSREERIAIVKEQRAVKLERQNSATSTTGVSQDGVMSELKDVIAQIKHKRGLPVDADMTKLGSPLEIEEAQQTGRFGLLQAEGRQIRSSSISSSSSRSPTSEHSTTSPIGQARTRRVRASSNESDSAGNKSRRQSQAINGMISGMGTNWGVFDPSSPAASSLEAVMEGQESTDVTPTAPTAPRRNGSITLQASASSVSLLSNSSISSTHSSAAGGASAPLSRAGRSSSSLRRRMADIASAGSAMQSEQAQAPAQQTQQQQLQSSGSQRRIVPVGSAF